MPHYPHVILPAVDAADVDRRRPPPRPPRAGEAGRVGALRPTVG